MGLCSCHSLGPILPVSSGAPCTPHTRSFPNTAGIFPPQRPCSRCFLGLERHSQLLQWEFLFSSSQVHLKCLDPQSPSLFTLPLGTLASAHPAPWGQGSTHSWPNAPLLPAQGSSPRDLWDRRSLWQCTSHSGVCAQFSLRRGRMEPSPSRPIHTTPLSAWCTVIKAATPLLIKGAQDGILARVECCIPVFGEGGVSPNPRG